MKSALHAVAVTFVFFLISLSALPANAEGLEITARERLGAFTKAELLYSIDSHHTFVAGEGLFIYRDEDLGFDEVHAFESDGRTFFVVRHDEPQPLLYRSPALPNYDALTVESARKMTLEPAGSWIEGKDEIGYTAADLFEHAYAACFKTDGKLSFVVTKELGKFKRLVEVGAVEAFTEIIAAKEDNAWFIACDGPYRFVVTKDYSVMTKGENLASLAPGRTLSGINYLKKGEFSMTFADTADTASEEKPIESFLERMASEVAIVKEKLARVRKGTECLERRIEHLEGAKPADGTAPAAPAAEGIQKGKDGDEPYGLKVCDAVVESFEREASADTIDAKNLQAFILN